MPQRVLLCSLNGEAAIPDLPIYLAPDCVLDQGAQTVRIERIDLPALRAVVCDKPLVPRVGLLFGRSKRRQSVEVFSTESNPIKFDVVAAIPTQSVGQIVLGHVEAGRVIVADVENLQRATIVILRDIVD